MLAALASHQSRQELFLRRRPEALDALRTVALVESSQSSTRARGGVWKSTNNEIQERDASGQVLRVRFRCLEAVAVPQAMGVLMDEIRSALERRGNDELLCIPLTLLLHYRSGWLLGRYISLERLVEDARAGYYESLEVSSQGWHEQRHDPLPWCPSP